MGYHIRESSVIRVRPLLDRMLSERMTLEFPTENSHDLAYLLNQAIQSAIQLDREDFKPYRDLKHMYRFRKGKEALVAEYVVLGNDYGNARAEFRAQATIAEVAKRETIPTAVGLIDVLASLMVKGDVDEIVFPNANLSKEDMIKLYGWTKEIENVQFGWAIIDQEDRGIILTKLDVPEEILFTPTGGQDGATGEG